MTTVGHALRLGAKLLLLAATATVLLLVLVAPSPARLRSAWHALRPQAETRYTRYDSLLGWASQPGVTAPDMYGPGRSLTINTQGFRHGGTITPDARPRRRVICVGDSFTFGYGVGDADTWCQRLAAGDSTVETVNMGQEGYGVDQAFLWYRRDAATLKHDLVLFAFIATDFDRMRSARFDGYPKPTLMLTDSGVAAAHVPVPRGLGVRGRLQRAFFELERTRAAGTVLGTGHTGRRSAADPDPLDTLVNAVVAELDALVRQRGARLVLIALPTARDYRGDEADHWRHTVSIAAHREGVSWVDLITAMRGLPADSASALFIPRDGHYSAAGHVWVAARLRTIVAAAFPPPR